MKIIVKALLRTAIKNAKKNQNWNGTRQQFLNAVDAAHRKGFISDLKAFNYVIDAMSIQSN